MTTSEWDNRAPEPFLTEEECRRAVVDNDLRVLERKDKSYGSSWRKRGGIGAFMMLARKWDRIESIMQRFHHTEGIGTARQYDLFQQVVYNDGDVLDDIRDLRRYLILAEGYLLQQDKIKLDE